MSAEITVPGYTIVKKVADGGSASIFKAKKHPYENIVALKVLHPQFVGNKEMVRAFDREAEVLARIKHPSIIKFGGRVAKAPRPTIELEMFDSTTLRTVIARSGGKLTVADTAKILKPIAEALSYVHSLQLAHLDMKPENICVDENLQVRLIDFSIARDTRRSISERIASIFAAKKGDATIQGTLIYLSPEQIKRSDPAGPADIYSFGLVLHECLAGAPPFRGHDQKAIIKQHLSDPAPWVEKVRPDCPADLALLIRSMLEKDPAKRPDATAVAQVLAKYAG